MLIKSFHIKNFKGVQDCKIDLTAGGGGSIVTLIGLNESGKTTILEALSNIYHLEDGLAAIVGHRKPDGREAEFVPKSKKANFTGDIEIGALVQMDESDVENLSEAIWKKYNLMLDAAKLPREFSITRTYEFEKSECTNNVVLWDVVFFLKKKTQRRFTKYDGASEDAETFDVWDFCTNILEKRIPQICYFPTFLFQIPDRIYLEGDGQSESNEYYRQVLQDVLDSQGGGLTLQDHVIERITKERSVLGNAAEFWARFFGRDAKDQVDAVFREMSVHLSRTIFGAWNEIFKHHPKNKRIVVEWGVDPQKDNAPFAQLFILDGQSKYALSERSLGFRWFFCFLLFTQFRISRRAGPGTVFLFDEPASNLHSKAQLQLLESFSKVASGQNSIIYSTHSHYMIQPLWLEKAYIVANRAIDYEDKSDDLDYFSTAPTKISVEKFRNFVAQYPNRTTYFQPVLDRLDYAVSPMIGSQPCLIVEGKYDFYALKYFFSGTMQAGFDILPGTGAGNMETIISLCVGWGRKFLILLDDDDAGRKSKSRYIDEYLLSEDQVMTLGDLKANFLGKKLEGLFSSGFAALVKIKNGLDRSPRKKDYALFFQERLATSTNLNASDIDIDTKRNLEEVLKVVRAKLTNT